MFFSNQALSASTLTSSLPTVYVAGSYGVLYLISCSACPSILFLLGSMMSRSANLIKFLSSYTDTLFNRSILTNGCCTPNTVKLFFVVSFLNILVFPTRLPLTVYVGLPTTITLAVESIALPNPSLTVSSASNRSASI